MRTTFSAALPWRTLAAAVLTLTAACGGGDADGDGDDNNDDGGALLPTGEGPCEEPSECQGDACIAILDGDNPPIYCTEPCSAGSCPDGFFCDADTFALTGFAFCRFGETQPEEPPPEAPRRPCRTDAQCEAGEVCATWEGERGCTLACDVESDCTPPPAGGFTFDYLTCAADETAGQSRDVCVPDPGCFEDPLSCTTF